jgi:hypothetical protein
MPCCHALLLAEHQRSEGGMPPLVSPRLRRAALGPAFGVSTPNHSAALEEMDGLQRLNHGV